MRAVITAGDLERIPAGGELEIPEDALVTALAREEAERRGIKFRVIEKGREAPSKSEARSRGVVAIAADHGGFELKKQLAGHLRDWGYEVLDLGTNSADSVDYPDFAAAAAEAVASGKAWRGIVIDSAGIGSSIAANKVPGARAALCYDRATARNSREHNDANILTLGAKLISPEEAREIAAVWLETKFGGGRHEKRIERIKQIEAKYSKTRPA
jgi:ribose 5-phosphate isomerase B